MNNKVVPLGGVHKSAHSMLAEVMNDPGGLKSVVVFVIHDDDTSVTGQFNMSRAEMAYASLVIGERALSHDL